MRRLYEMHGQGSSIRQIAKELGVSRNTVRKYLRSDGVPKPAPRVRRVSVLDPFKEYVTSRVGEGADNCQVLLREIRAQGYTGGKTALKDFVRPLRRAPLPKATSRYETRPGDQAQVDFGFFRHHTPDGKTRSLWAFVMVLSWSRAIYVEFIEKTDTPTFIRCHLNAFSHFGGVPRSGLYDNTKVVVLGQNEAGERVLNPRFLDFSRRIDLDVRLCRPYRAQTKGRVESGVKYVRNNFWPSARFTDLADLNRQALAWRVPKGFASIPSSRRRFRAWHRGVDSGSPQPSQSRRRLTGSDQPATHTADSVRGLLLSPSPDHGSRTCVHVVCRAVSGLVACGPVRRSHCEHVGSLVPSVPGVRPGG